MNNLVSSAKKQKPNLKKSAKETPALKFIKGVVNPYRWAWWNGEREANGRKKIRPNIYKDQFAKNLARYRSGAQPYVSNKLPNSAIVNVWSGADHCKLYFYGNTDPYGRTLAYDDFDATTPEEFQEAQRLQQHIQERWFPHDVAERSSTTGLCAYRVDTLGGKTIEEYRKIKSEYAKAIEDYRQFHGFKIHKFEVKGVPGTEGNYGTCAKFPSHARVEQLSAVYSFPDGTARHEHEISPDYYSAITATIRRELPQSFKPPKQKSGSCEILKAEQFNNIPAYEHLLQSIGADHLNCNDLKHKVKAKRLAIYLCILELLDDAKLNTPEKLPNDPQWWGTLPSQLIENIWKEAYRLGFVDLAFGRVYMKVMRDYLSQVLRWLDWEDNKYTPGITLENGKKTGIAMKWGILAAARLKLQQYAKQWAQNEDRNTVLHSSSILSSTTFASLDLYRLDGLPLLPQNTNSILCESLEAAFAQFLENQAAGSAEIDRENPQIPATDYELAV